MPENQPKRSRWLRGVFATLFHEHPRDNYLFYFFDVSFEETVRLHPGHEAGRIG